MDFTPALTFVEGGVRRDCGCESSSSSGSGSSYDSRPPSFLISDGSVATSTSSHSTTIDDSLHEATYMLKVSNESKFSKDSLDTIRTISNQLFREGDSQTYEGKSSLNNATNFNSAPDNERLKKSCRTSFLSRKEAGVVNRTKILSVVGNTCADLFLNISSYLHLFIVYLY